MSSNLIDSKNLIITTSSDSESKYNLYIDVKTCLFKLEILSELTFGMFTVSLLRFLLSKVEKISPQEILYVYFTS